MNEHDLLHQTAFTTNGWGLALIGLAVIVVIPFFIAKRPAPAEPGEGCFDAANRLLGNIAWWLIFASCLVVGLALIGEAAGFDTIPNFGPRGSY